jgi:hypothetical protein
VPPEIPVKALLDKPAVAPKPLETDFLNGLLALPRNATMNAQAAQIFGFADTRPTENPAAAALADLPSRIRLQPENVRNGLAQLVLTLVELLRELLERQALRRIDAGSLASDDVERLGTTFLRLAEEIDRLKRHFGLSDEDLNLNLGPLGKLR